MATGKPTNRSHSSLLLMFLVCRTNQTNPQKPWTADPPPLLPPLSVLFPPQSRQLADAIRRCCIVRPASVKLHPADRISNAVTFLPPPSSSSSSSSSSSPASASPASASAPSPVSRKTFAVSSSGYHHVQVLKRKEKK
ncbi:hypothetical protein LY78DRAFT_266695 [Colletotrichum sublineola]|nr:hypothetical protein LY78DRAFT_266695 [Colletotrichum sublineola]